MVNSVSVAIYTFLYADIAFWIWDIAAEQYKIYH